MSTIENHIPGKQLTNPFVGLRAFEESEDYLFFGRSKQIGELLEKFSESRFLAVIGSSGSGKSSLIKSGLLPAIYSGFMTVGSNWRVALMRPGENPIGYLAKQLAKEGTLYENTKDSDIPYEAIVESSLRRSENGLVQVYKEARLSQSENLLVIVDQFEELFRFSKYERENNLGKSDAVHFIRILLSATRQKECPVYVLLTMRSDFLGDCAEFRGLPEAINNGQYLVPRMIRDEIREAITGPVTVSTAAISQRLVTRLLNDINNDTDQLPILQHAMMRTWDAWYKRNQYNTPIDFEDYEVIGTMEHALSLHADEAYSELTTEKERHITHKKFKALTDKAADIRGIRRPRSIADLCILTEGTEAQIKNVVEVFRKPGRTFLMPPPHIPLTDKSIIDISHESLMRVWERLVHWTEEETRSGDLYMRLVNSAQLKEAGQRGLLKNPELEIALKWKRQNNPTAKWAEGYKGDFEQAMAYLEDSRKEDLAEKKVFADKESTRKRLRKAVFALLGLLVVASVIVAIILNEKSIILDRKSKQYEAAWRAAKRSDSTARAQTRLALEAKRNDSIARLDAIHKKAEAVTAKLIAIKEKNSADSAKAYALVQQQIAFAQKDSADNARADAVLQKDIAKKQTLRIAANEYARLIRDGPSAGNNNYEEFYDDDYLLAYTFHFDRLGNLVAPEDRGVYKSLRNKLYYNNDLYERVYEAFAEKKSIQTLVKEDNSTANDLNTKPFGTNESATITQNALKISNSSGDDKYSESPGKGQRFIALVVSSKRHLIFCSTTNNFIYVYNDKLDKIDSIAMGTIVTALDFNDENNIVYFGTTIGYIGYIKYSKDKRNQPVFENKLETEVTAIQLFKHDGESFLLATGKRSSPKVYKLEENSLTPDNRLIGNELPYQKSYGDIIGAEYLPKLDRVRLVTHTTSMRIYLWNPFTKELLDALKEKENFHPGTSGTDQLIHKTQIYLER